MAESGRLGMGIWEGRLELGKNQLVFFSQVASYGMARRIWVIGVFFVHGKRVVK